MPMHPGRAQPFDWLMAGKPGRLTTANEPLRGAMNDVLAALGPAGVDALEAAAKCGDPSIRGSARSALSMLKTRTKSPTPRRD